MATIRIYLYQDEKGVQSVVIPTPVITEDGIYIEVAPVTVARLKDETAWKQAVVKTLSAQPQAVQAADYGQEPGSYLLEKLNLTKWADFEKRSAMLTVHQGSRYLTIFKTGKNRDLMWTHEEANKRVLDRRAPVEAVIDALAEEFARGLGEPKRYEIRLSSS